MEKPIINRVASSAIVTLDLEDYYPDGKRALLDISPWLFEGIVLREKDFRKYIKTHNWSQYQDEYGALGCSTEAIVPAWAYMLVSLALAPFAKKTVIGTLETLESILYSKIIENLNVDQFVGKPVIIKGCASKPIPENAFVLISQKLQPVARSIMYGEACSSVPLFKKSN